MDALALTGADPLTDLLNGVRTTGAVFNRSSLAGAWALRFATGSPLVLIVALRGPAWVIAQGVDPVRLGPGDVAVLCGGAPFAVADDPATEPHVTILSGQRCVIRDGEEMSTEPGVGEWGTTRPDCTVLMSGMYAVDSGTPRRLLAALPPLALVRAEQGALLVDPMVLDNVTSAEPGHQVLLDRILDLMLITALRAWLIRPGAQVPAWYRAHCDPVVGTALRLLHTDLSLPWTVAELAAKAGTSRAALSRRFTALVGQPPMTYQREQRLTLAADLLRDSDATVAAVAGRVGFSSAFALSAAFKRERGLSPSQYRTGTTRAE